MSAFSQEQESYGQKPLKLIRASMIRWLSHLDAYARVVATYESLIDALDSIYHDTKEPEVHGIRHPMTNKNFVGMMLLLCDVLQPVNILSLYLQQEQVNFTYRDSRVQTTLDSLSEFIVKYQGGQYDDTEMSKCDALFDIITER